LIGAVWPVCFLVGPLLYFYIRELSSSKRIVFSRRQFFHFLPSGVSALLLILFYRLNANESVPRMLSLIAPLEVIRLPVLKALPLLAVTLMTVYLVLSFLSIRTYSSGIKQSFSSLEKISLSWLRTLLTSFICLLILFNFFSYVAAHLGINRKSGYLVYMGMAVVTYIMAFKALLRPEIFSQIEVAHQAELIRTDEVTVPVSTASAPDKPEGPIALISKAKYQKSLLTDERVAEITRQLFELMESKKPFLEPELTLAELADKLSLSPHHLSQVFNREMKKSFFDFVNEYRVREAKKLLSSPQYGHYSIFGIALDAGFNSKSAFYTAFGKYAGTTPSEFRKQQQQARSEQGAVPNLQ
jgi:AraC-like DNA-binding protein